MPEETNRVPPALGTDLKTLGGRWDAPTNGDAVTTLSTWRFGTPGVCCSRPCSSSPWVDVTIDTTGGLARIGLPDEFLDRIRARNAPGTSALFLLTRDDVPSLLREAVAESRPEVFPPSRPDQETALRHAFDTRLDFASGAG
jgi:uncharacterized protein DUF1269